MSGWIKLWRKLLDNEVLQNQTRLALFVRMLLRAATEPTEVYYKGKLRKLERGQLWLSERDEANALGCDRQRIRTAFGVLQKAGILTRETTHDLTLISIAKFDTYQSNSASANPPTKPPTNPELTQSQPTEQEEEKIKKGEGRESVSRQRATRLPDAWSPSPDLVADAESFGLTPRQVADQTSRFRDYWHGAPGSRGTKLDWPATYRNWMRRAADEMSRSGASVREGSRMANGQPDPVIVAYRNLSKRYTQHGEHSPVTDPPDYVDEVPFLSIN